MSKRIDLEDAVFRLEMLTDTFIALEEAVECAKNKLPRHYLLMPVSELKKVCNEMVDIILKVP